MFIIWFELYCFIQLIFLFYLGRVSSPTTSWNPGIFQHGPSGRQECGGEISGSWFTGEAYGDDGT